jgi:hypothetical protein
VGVGRAPWEIKNNYICSPVNKQFIKEEGNWKQAMPTQIGNVTSATCEVIASAGPTISPSPSGTYNDRVKVTLTDAGLTHGPGPPGEYLYLLHYGWKYSDHHFQPLYRPLFPQPGTTVKAIGMWGGGANPKSYPPGYGFVPSAVQSAYYAQSKKEGTH